MKDGRNVIHNMFRNINTLFCKHICNKKYYKRKYPLVDPYMEPFNTRQLCNYLHYTKTQRASNSIIGSKVTAILLNWRILPSGGVESGRVCACSLRSRLVLTTTGIILDFFRKGGYCLVMELYREHKCLISHYNFLAYSHLYLIITNVPL